MDAEQGARREEAAPPPQLSEAQAAVLLELQKTAQVAHAV